MTDSNGPSFPVPNIRFDFGFRPDYWVPHDPLQLVVGNMTGEIRR